MRRHPRQLENFVRNLGIQLGPGNLGSSSLSRLSEPVAKCLEPGVHLEANRITNGNTG
jgi:hypothetical protein